MNLRQPLFFLIGIGFLQAGCSAVTLTNNAFEHSLALVGLGPNKVGSIGVLVLPSKTPRAQVFEIAFAYGDAAATVLTSASASQWFSERPGYCRSYSRQLDVIRLEVPMGYSLLLTELPDGHEQAQSIFAFAKEVGKTEITSFESPWLQVMNEMLSVLEAAPGLERSGKTIETGGGSEEIC